MEQGRLEPDYPVNAIKQKGVYRRDLGDVEALAESIGRLGLLTPIVVTSDGLLLCGRRRLAAVQRLGWDSVPVWIPDQVSKNLRVMALFDDDALRKPLTPLEQAKLYAEYHELYGAQARLRYEATRFGAQGVVGGAESPPPSGEGPADHVKTRIKAALAVTGKQSHQRLEEVLWLDGVAQNQAEDESVRRDAEQALVEIEQDGKVHPRWQRVQCHQNLARLDAFAADPAEPDTVRATASRLAAEARAQTSASQALRRSRQGLARVKRLRMPERSTTAAAQRTVREVVRIVRSEWEGVAKVDPTVFGRFATDEQWQLVECHIRSAKWFLDEGVRAREAAAHPNDPAFAYVPTDPPVCDCRPALQAVG